MYLYKNSKADMNSTLILFVISSLVILWLISLFFSSEEVEKEIYDSRKYYTAAALTTVIVRVFGVRSTTHALDRFPTFVNKERSFRPKFIKYSRKVCILNLLL